MTDEQFKALCSEVRRFARYRFNCGSCGCDYIAMDYRGMCPACAPGDDQAEMLGARSQEFESLYPDHEKQV